MPPYIAPQGAGYTEAVIAVQATPSTIQQTDTSVSGTWPVVHPLTEQDLMEQLYREGKILNLPKPQPLSSEEQAEREHLAELFGGGKTMSEIIIEGRGPH